MRTMSTALLPPLARSSAAQHSTAAGVDSCLGIRHVGMTRGDLQLE